MPTLQLRQARREDVERLAELNVAAYPDLAGDGVVFEPLQLARHQAIFPAGQIVAAEQGRIVGAIATLAVPSAYALAPHTWAGITADGTFATHDDGGDAIYLADVYVEPTAWGRGIGAALYAELWSLCRRHGGKRVVAGGRLWGYHLVAERMSPQAYVDEVVRGARKDKVLTSQLRAGFTVQGILDGYLLDARSRSYATLLVWTNRLAVPDQAAASSGREPATLATTPASGA